MQYVIQTLMNVSKFKTSVERTLPVTTLREVTRVDVKLVTSWLMEAALVSLLTFYRPHFGGDVFILFVSSKGDGVGLWVCLPIIHPLARPHKTAGLGSPLAVTQEDSLV